MCILRLTHRCAKTDNSNLMAEGGISLSNAWILPFVIFLLCVAIIPLINHHFWDRHLWWFSLGFFCFPMVYALVFILGGPFIQKTVEKCMEYVSFMILLASLYVISGGILIRGHFRGTPLVNTCFLVVGSVFASLIGTTGASMLLIRPLLRANAGRKRTAHIVVFFIFTVSNIGGLLTPLGDPPLFLGYLQGVPFLWTIQLWKEWLFVLTLVIALFWLVDAYILRKDGKGIDLHHHDTTEKFHISGVLNLILLLGVVASIFFHGYFLRTVSGWPHFGPQEGSMLVLTCVSLLAMPVSHEIRLQNGFSWKPILEVMFLFAAIFATMIPALHILETRATSLGISAPWQFFLASGLLSSLLDNAPTYLAFLSVAKGLALANDAGFVFHDGTHVSAAILAAISCGSVFMGANTYIGNGPNFMVRAIAAERGVKMPGFFGYMGYSAVILLPIFALVAWIFF